MNYNYFFLKHNLIIMEVLKWIASVLGVIAIVGFLVAMMVFLYKKLTSLNYSELINKQKVKTSESKQNRQAKQGVWAFPSELFFRKCSENYITEFKTDYSIQKATNIVISLANTAGISEENLARYLNPAKFEKYYNQGKVIADKVDNAEMLRKKQPRKATPVYSESVFFRRVAKLAGLTGLDKRRKMLTYLLEDFRQKIEVKKEYEDSLGVFEEAMILRPQKEHIPNQSAINLDLGQNAFYLMCGIPDLPYDVELFEECANEVKDQLENINSKVVLSIPTSADILSNLRICKTDIKKGDSGVLHINLSIAPKKPFELDIPPNIPMVVDGVLQGTVMFESSPVGEVLFPLPLYGIPVNTTKATKLSGLCAYSVESDYNTESWSKFMDIDSPNHISEILGDLLDEEADSSPSVLSDSGYTVKLADTQDLWIMEV